MEIAFAADKDFFFSSRRRHTRSDRDWSSDVCSSDLVEDEIAEALGAEVRAVHQPVEGAGPEPVAAAERVSRHGRCLPSTDSPRTAGVDYRLASDGGAPAPRCPKVRTAAPRRPPARTAPPRGVRGG